MDTDVLVNGLVEGGPAVRPAGPDVRARPPVAPRGPRRWLVFLLLAGAAALAYPFVPAAPFDVLYLGIGFLAVVATVIGIRRNRPVRRTPWLLLASGLAGRVAGDLVYTILAEQAGTEPSFPGLYDLAYLLGTATIVAGGIAFVVSGRASTPRGPLIDASVVATAGCLILWLTIGVSLVTTPGATVAEVIVGLAYPAMDVALLGVLTAMLFGGRARGTTPLLLIGAFVVQLVTDSVFATQELAGAYVSGQLLDSGWLLAYILIAAATLHPNVHRPPATTPMPVLSRRHFALLGVPVIIAGASVMVSAAAILPEDPDGFLLNVLVGVPIALVMCSLLLWRVASSLSDLAVSAHERDQARNRELTLADVAARLALADDVSTVREAIRGAARLVGNGATIELHLPGDAEQPSPQPDETSVSLTPIPADGWLAIRGAAVPEEVLPALGRVASGVVMAIDRCNLASDLRDNEQRFRSLVRHAPDAITVHDAEGRLTYASPALGRIVGIDEGELIGTRWRDLLHPDDLRRLRAINAEILATPHATVVVETRLRHRDGGWRWIETRMTNLLHDPAVGGIVANHRDTTERQRLQRQLEHQATHDALTGLANRRQFSEAVREVQGRVHNAVIFLDLDRFKEVNDRLGHAVGDRLLQATAHRIRSVIRPGDLPARLGGDEFAVLLRRSTTAEAHEVAERVLEAVSLPLEADGIEIMGTASIGVAVTDGDDDRLHDLLHEADQAMYTAKREGRGRIARYSAQSRLDTADRLELESELTTALADGALSLAYEPVVSLATGTLVGAEAAVRWIHPSRGDIPTSTFLPIAARIGLLGAITDWAVREACWQAHQWTQISPMFLTSVELATAALHDGSFAEDTETVLVATDLPPSSLVLTVDASVLVDQTPHVLETLDRLRKIGVRLRLAGFGASRAPIDLLRWATVDELQISPAFVTGLEGGPEDAAIAHAVIQLARSFGLVSVALGVASDGQRQQLERRSCDRACGPMFGYPGPAERITSMLSASMVAEHR